MSGPEKRPSLPKTGDKERSGRRSSKVDSKSKVGSLSDTIVAVFPDGKAGKKALEALQLAVDTSASNIERIPFEQLDFGDLKALDKFYSAPVVVIDVTEVQYEACLYYQIGLRESFGMKHNVVMCLDRESNYMAAGKKASDQTSLGVGGILYRGGCACHIAFLLGCGLFLPSS